MSEFLSKLALKFSFLLTFLDWAQRSLRSRVCSSREISNFIRDSGVSKLSPPNLINSAINRRFIWRQDHSFMGLPLDYAKDPEVFLFDGKDDCDGFAMFAEYICLEMGFEDVSRVMVRSKSGKGHAVCVVLFPDGFKWCLGNWPEIQFPQGDLKTIGQVIAMKMGGDLDFAIRAKGYSIVEYVAG